MSAEKPNEEFADVPPESPQAGEAPQPESVEQLFREHNEALIRFLLARLRSQQEAREVAQEAYVRLLSLDKPGAISYLRAFLFRTAANIAVDRMRRDELSVRAKRSPFFNELADGRTPERQVVAAETLEKLERLLSGMSAKCRQAFMMRRFEGKDVGSIAQDLRISKRMVRTYVAQALLKCRAHLDLEAGVQDDE